MLMKYLTKLPYDASPKRDIYVKLENRFRALPKKYRDTITNISLLDDYYDRLMDMEEGNRQKVEINQEHKELKKEKGSQKEKHWLW